DLAKSQIDALVKQYPEGALLRNTRGKQWSKDALSSAVREIRIRTGIEGLVAYTLRHTFATEALTSGEDSVTTGILMGHKDTTMVAKVYSHLTKKPHFLRAAAKRARGEKPTENMSAAG